MISKQEFEKKQQQFKKLIQNKYLKIDKIGEGTYGHVFKGKDKETNQFVAIKAIKMEDEELGIPYTALREISFLKLLLNVLYSCNPKKLYLVFEYVNEDLYQFMRIQQNIGISEYQIKSYMFQILNAVNFCHMNGIIHRDLKPQNILITNEGYIKLCDFGLARKYQIPVSATIQDQSKTIQSLWYRAPEVLLGDKDYSLPIDVWSIGLIFIEFYILKPLLIGDSEIGQIFKIFQFFGTPLKEDIPSMYCLPDMRETFPKFQPITDEELLKMFKDDFFALSLFKEMTLLDPTRRISAKQAMNHKFFDSLDKNSKIYSKIK